MLKLSQIYIYPIKALGAISLQSSKVEARGLQYDRRWMLVTPKGKFITQRQFPALCMLQPSITDQGILVENKQQTNMPALFIPFEIESGKDIQVRIWNDSCQASTVSEEADKWLSEALGGDFHLVYMPDSSERKVDPEYAKQGEIVSFADGYPFLIIGQASLDQLNAKLQQAVEMIRFRPNFVFTGGNAQQEDEWTHFRIGNVDFEGVKLCARCSVPNINPSTAEQGAEPTISLATYRRQNGKIMFGQNLLSSGNGRVQVGDEIVLS